MDPIRVLIVDDEPLARQGVRRMLESDAEIVIVGECGDGVEALEAITAQHPDLVFLDVQMPEMDGFEVLDHIEPDEMPLVVFLTAYDQHALRAFQVHALDYLLKPFDRERFQEALNRAKGRARHKRGGELTQRTLSMLGQSRPDRGHLERIMIKSGGRVSFLRTEEVDWLEAQGDYVCLHCQGKKHLLREKISHLEMQLSPVAFLRIHRSTIVNVARIKEMQPLFHGEYVVMLADGTRLTMSRSFRDKVFQSLTGSVPASGK
jgi:two-component system, LytTR family, response regulator